MSDFRKDLENLINKYSMENGSSTPDFILAAYLTEQLALFGKTIQARESWYGRNPPVLNRGDQPAPPSDLPIPIGGVSRSSDVDEMIKEGEEESVRDRMEEELKSMEGFE